MAVKLQDICCSPASSTSPYRLVGLVVKASALGAADLRFKSRLRRDFSRSNHTSDFKIGTPVATLPGAWHYRVSAGTGWHGVSILWLGEVESLICSFYLSVAACKIVQIRPWDTLAYCSDVEQPTNKLQATEEGYLARPYPNGQRVLWKPGGPTVYCHSHRGDWSFHLTYEKKVCFIHVALYPCGPPSGELMTTIMVTLFNHC